MTEGVKIGIKNRRVASVKQENPQKIAVEMQSTATTLQGK